MPYWFVLCLVVLCSFAFSVLKNMLCCVFLCCDGSSCIVLYCVVMCCVVFRRIVLSSVV